MDVQVCDWQVVEEKAGERRVFGGNVRVIAARDCCASFSEPRGWAMRWDGGALSALDEPRNMAPSAVDGDD